jgi:hydrogenase maturation protein HypF
LAKALRTGKIVALRGLGGYQLAVDATNAKAVQRLRLRKRRPSKPLAVMVRSLEQAESYASLTDQHRRLLSSSERPIVLVPVKDRIPLCGEVHPGLHEVGLFLPTTALHWLLLDQVQRPLVVTSGNVDGDPLSVTPKEAERQLKGIADLWLHHNRDIAHAIDDSVVRSIADRSVTIRCARGAAPLPLKSVNEFATRSVELRANTAGLDVSAPPVLAVGGHQKGAIALFNGAQAVLGPHIGDLDSLPARERFDEHVRQMWDLYRCEPRRIVHDLHPDYFTTCWAQSSGYPTLAVQHHHAHVVSGMVEMGWLDREVIGVAFDGTGYGIDGTVWGGEFLRATVEGFQRVGHLRPFHLPGGETAIRQPWRVAASLIVAAVGEVQTRQVLKSIGVDDTEAMAVLRLIKNKRLSPVTSSAGRLFDGVAAIALGVVSADNEGQPAMLLESAADPMVEASYEFSILGTKPFQLDWTPMIKQLLDDRQAGLPLEVMAAKFHNGLARAIVKVCSRFRLPIILSGGVFQNRLLTEHVVEELADSRQPLGLHQEIPPNDGGLAAGQLAVGLARFAGAHQRRPCAFEGVR